MRVPVVNRAIQLDAWIAKKFLVLIKRKLARQQIPRNVLFKKLLGAVFPSVTPDEPDAEDDPHPEAYYPIHYDLFVFNHVTIVDFGEYHWIS